LASIESTVSSLKRRASANLQQSELLLTLCNIPAAAQNVENSC
jgi:hypothetical protein